MPTPYISETSFSSGGFRLRGVLHHPGTSQPPIVVGSHGLESDGDSPKQTSLAHRCVDAGIAYFRFDHRGCGKSEGVFSKVTSLDSRKEDLLSAITFLQSKQDIGNKLGLFGSSMGGATCIAVADVLEVSSFVLLAAPVIGGSMIRPPEELEDMPELTISFYQKLLQFNLTDKLEHVKNVLIFHGDKDDIVPISNADLIYEKSGGPKKIIRQEGGGHRVEKPEHQREFIEEASAWYKNTFL